jgi:hypothetical protein
MIPMFELDPVTDLLLCFALGVGALVTGVLTFFLERRNVRMAAWTFPLALGLVLAAPAAGLALTGTDSSCLMPLAVLASFFVAVAAARTPLIELASRRFVVLLRRARVAPACLALLGLGLVGWQIFAMDRRLNADIEMADTTLRRTNLPGIEPIPGALLWTDKGREIQLMRMGHDPEGNPQEEANYLRSLGLDFKAIRTGPWDESYNCHGWVFADGRAWISGESVDTILEDNDYRVVSTPTVGDVVIFRTAQGKVSHSALVRAITDDGRVLLESKWGKMGRYLHPIDQHAYSTHQATFYHGSRSDHQLHQTKAEAESILAQ